MIRLQNLTPYENQIAQVQKSLRHFGSFSEMGTSVQVKIFGLLSTLSSLHGNHAEAENQLSRKEITSQALDMIEMHRRETRRIQKIVREIFDCVNNLNSYLYNDFLERVDDLENCIDEATVPDLEKSFQRLEAFQSHVIEIFNIHLDKMERKLPDEFENIYLWHYYFDLLAWARKYSDDFHKDRLCLSQYLCDQIDHVISEKT